METLSPKLRAKCTLNLEFTFHLVTAIQFIEVRQSGKHRIADRNRNMSIVEAKAEMSSKTNKCEISQAFAQPSALIELFMYSIMQLLFITIALPLKVIHDIRTDGYLKTLYILWST